MKMAELFRAVNAVSRSSSTNATSCKRAAPAFAASATSICAGTRRQSPSVAERRLATPPVDLKRKAIAILHEIGRTILSAYDCYEE